MFERRLYHHIDWALLIAMFALCALGVAMIFSTTSDPTRGNSHLYITQLYAIGLGSIAMVFTLTLDYRTFTDKSHLIYIGLLAILLYVLFLGTVQMGARRWIPIGGFDLQPSEFAKVGVALVLAKYFGENRGMPNWTDLAIPKPHPQPTILKLEFANQAPIASAWSRPTAYSPPFMADRPQLPGSLLAIPQPH